MSSAHGLAIAAFAIFFTLGAGLGVACLRLRRAAEAEHAEAVLRGAIDALDHEEER